MHIVGVWEHFLIGSSDFREIKQDGTMILASGKVEKLEEQPYSLSEGRFERNRIMVKTTESILPENSACIDIVGIYEVYLLADGSL